MSKSKANPTLDDIAAHSGVSAATVSRVLNRSGSVSKALAIKVNQSLRELGFKQAIKGFLAILVPDLSSLTVADKLTGVYSEAEKLGYTVVPIHIGNSKEVTERNLQLIKVLGFDALIILKDRLDPEELREQYQLGAVPIVLVNHRVNQPHVHCIDIDRDIGMYKAAKYLMSLGHRKIAYFSAPLDSLVAIDRKKGIEKALNEAGQSYIIRQADASVESGFQMTGTLLNDSHSEKPTAIIAFDDLVAVGCLNALNLSGYKIPEDISLIGFDDLFITRHTNPPLTTVHQPWHRMGQLAVTKIDNILAGRDTDLGGLTILECPLIVRESTGPAPESV
jgi:DNA-binding LacI/PurR family transcriptional regulator